MINNICIPTIAIDNVFKWNISASDIVLVNMEYLSISQVCPAVILLSRQPATNGDLVNWVSPLCGIMHCIFFGGGEAVSKECKAPDCMQVWAVTD